MSNPAFLLYCHRFESLAIISRPLQRRFTDLQQLVHFRRDYFVCFLIVCFPE